MKLINYWNWVNSEKTYHWINLRQRPIDPGRITRRNVRCVCCNQSRMNKETKSVECYYYLRNVEDLSDRCREHLLKDHLETESKIHFLRVILWMIIFLLQQGPIKPPTHLVRKFYLEYSSDYALLHEKIGKEIHWMQTLSWEFECVRNSHSKSQRKISINVQKSELFVVLIADKSSKRSESPSIHYTDCNSQIIQPFQEWRFQRWDKTSSTGRALVNRGQTNMLHYITVLRDEPLKITHPVSEGGRHNTTRKIQKHVHDSHTICVLRKCLTLVVSFRVERFGCWYMSCPTCPNVNNKNEKMNKIRINIVIKNEKITTVDKNKKKRTVQRKKRQRETSFFGNFRDDSKKKDYFTIGSVTEKSYEKSRSNWDQKSHFEKNEYKEGRLPFFFVMPKGRTSSCKRLTWKFLKLVDKMIKERENRKLFFDSVFPWLVAVSLLQLVMCCCSLFTTNTSCDNRDYQKNVESSGSCTRRSFRGLPQGSSSRWSPSIQYAKQTNQPYSGVTISGALVNETNQTCYTT